MQTARCNAVRAALLFTAVLGALCQCRLRAAQADVFLHELIAQEKVLREFDTWKDRVKLPRKSLRTLPDLTVVLQEYGTVKSYHPQEGRESGYQLTPPHEERAPISVYARMVDSPLEAKEWLACKLVGHVGTLAALGSQYDLGDVCFYPDFVEGRNPLQFTRSNVYVALQGPDHARPDVILAAASAIDAELVRLLEMAPDDAPEDIERRAQQRRPQSEVIEIPVEDICRVLMGFVEEGREKLGADDDVARGWSMLCARAMWLLVELRCPDAAPFLKEIALGPPEGELAGNLRRRAIWQVARLGGDGLVEFARTVCEDRSRLASHDRFILYENLARYVGVQSWKSGWRRIPTDEQDRPALRADVGRFLLQAVSHDPYNGNVMLLDQILSAASRFYALSNERLEVLKKLTNAPVARHRDYADKELKALQEVPSEARTRLPGSLKETAELEDLARAVLQSPEAYTELDRLLVYEALSAAAEEAGPGAAPDGELRKALEPAAVQRAPDGSPSPSGSEQLPPRREVDRAQVYTICELLRTLVEWGIKDLAKEDDAARRRCRLCGQAMELVVRLGCSNAPFFLLDIVQDESEGKLARDVRRTAIELATGLGGEGLVWIANDVCTDLRRFDDMDRYIVYKGLPPYVGVESWGSVPPRACIEPDRPPLRGDVFRILRASVSFDPYDGNVMLLDQVLSVASKFYALSGEREEVLKKLADAPVPRHRDYAVRELAALQAVAEEARTRLPGRLREPALRELARAVLQSPESHGELDRLVIYEALSAFGTSSHDLLLRAVTQERSADVVMRVDEKLCAKHERYKMSYEREDVLKRFEDSELPRQKDYFTAELQLLRQAPKEERTQLNAARPPE